MILPGRSLIIAHIPRVALALLAFVALAWCALASTEDRNWEQYPDWGTAPP